MSDTLNNLKILVKRTETGAIQEWTIFYGTDPVGGAFYYTVSGQTNGKKITNDKTYCFGKNAGKKNETSDAQQAEAEARAKWDKKLKSGYFTDIKDIDNETYVEPQLAKKYEDYASQLVFPIYSQPKLDGIRAIISKHGAFSRNGGKHVACPHILESLKLFFEKNPDTILDGELYCDKFNNDFNKICSLVKRTKPTKEELFESSQAIEYWVYDIIDTKKTFAERSDFITKNLFGNKIIIVETTKVKDKAELDNLYENYVEHGYEGQMIRTNSVYEKKRSKNLLKRKEFQDGEWKIIDIIEGVGNRSKMAGYMVFKTSSGETFKSNIKGDRALLKDYLLNKVNYIGKQATIRYFNLTPNKEIPRFPFVYSVRDYE